MKKFEDNKLEFIRLVKELDSYDRASSLIKDDNYDPKKTVLIGKKIHKLAIQLINYNLDEFLELLNDDELCVSEMCAEYAYPIYPNKCLLIMEKYMNSIEKDVDKIKIKSKIEGLKRNDTFFTILFKKLYNVENLNSLCRE